MAEPTTVTTADFLARRGLPDPTVRVALVVLWSASDPRRVGEVALLPAKATNPVVLGRGSSEADGEDRLRFLRQRPGRNERTRGATEAGVSRRQLAFSNDAGSWRFENVGRCQLRRNGQTATAGPLNEGDVLHLHGQLLLLVTSRPARLPALRDYPSSAIPDFGRADPQGLAGESPRAWALRDRLAFLARRDAHVLLLGASGTGKEAAARSVHQLSRRCKKALVSRNAATIPAGLADAELFGNVRDYPNPGMRERAGLVGQADGSTLFLDEIGELPTELQAHLLRVLDAGEYHRLGETRARQADLRLVAATNRSPEELKHDFLARFGLRLELPGLAARREDIPLILRHQLCTIAARDRDLADRFFEGGLPRLDPLLVEALVRHDYTVHARELMNLLWSSLSSSTGEVAELTPEVEGLLGVGPGRPRRAPGELTPEEIQACLDKHGGRQKDAWQELGLSGRHQLARLIKKHGLLVRPGPSG